MSWRCGKLVPLDAVVIPPGLLGVPDGSGCINYWGGRNLEGYGAIKLNGKAYRTHRLALEAKLGRPIETGCYACHSCDNPTCINPNHLWEGTPRENVVDAVGKGRVATPIEHRFKARLMLEEVAEIRRLRKTGMSQSAIALKFGISKTHVRRLTKPG